MTKKLLEDLHHSKVANRFGLGEHHWEACINMVQELEEHEHHQLELKSTTLIKTDDGKYMEVGSTDLLLGDAHGRAIENPVAEHISQGDKRTNKNLRK